MLKIMSAVGARPNFMKIAPFVHAIEEYNSERTMDRNRIDHYLVHTGQHYDRRMSELFFDALDIPQADMDLGIGSGTHAEQVGRTMIEFEKVVRKWKPDWIVVVGDVNATCACAITAKKQGVKLAHIESGLRSFDMDMPEEINRIVTDRLSDLLFTTDGIASANLRNEGVPEDKIKLVGNIMIDTLISQREKAKALDIKEIVTKNLLSPVSNCHEPLEPERFAMLTMHRPSNIDSKHVLAPIMEFIVDKVCRDMPLVWPIHPRARKQLMKFQLWDRVCNRPGLVLTQPLEYNELLNLNMNARIMLTDSGGLQEECCVLGTPCLTLRWNTERPVTLEKHGGVGILVGNDVDQIQTGYESMKKQPRQPHYPRLWDGHTATRIMAVFAKVA